jgi:hypothetical protein
MDCIGRDEIPLFTKVGRICEQSRQLEEISTKEEPNEESIFALFPLTQLLDAGVTPHNAALQMPDTSAPEPESASQIRTPSLLEFPQIPAAHVV